MLHWLGALGTFAVIRSVLGMFVSHLKKKINKETLWRYLGILLSYVTTIVLVAEIVTPMRNWITFNFWFNAKWIFGFRVNGSRKSLGSEVGALIFAILQRANF